MTLSSSSPGIVEHDWRDVVVAGGENDFARPVVVDGSVAIAGGDAKILIFAGDGLDPLIEADIETIVLGDPAVIFERIEPRGFAAEVKGMSPILSSSGVVSKNPCWSGRMIDGIDEAALVDDERLEASLRNLDGASQAGRGAASDDRGNVSVRVRLRLQLRAGQSFRGICSICGSVGVFIDVGWG